MTLTMGVKDDINQLSGHLTKLQKTQIPFATASALTQTAWNAREWARDSMERDLNKPKAFSLNAFQVKGATKARQVATIELKAIQANYLGWTIEGGTKQGEAIPVPYARARMTKATYHRWVARADTFEGEIKGIKGLWQRVGRHRVKLIHAHEQRVEYRPNQWRYYESVAKCIEARFPIHWNKAMVKALATAR